MDKIPYQTIIKMNAVIPDIKTDGSGSSEPVKKRMTLFEIADLVSQGKGV